MTFIGFNPREAPQKINDIGDILSSIEREFVRSTDKYLDILNDSWYSPKAVEFSSKIIPTLNDVEITMKNATTNIVNDASEAYNKIAFNNDIPPVQVSTVRFIKGQYKPLRSEKENGDVAIEVGNVKVATDEYIEQLEKVKGSLYNLPKNLSIYDETGDLEVAYNNRIEKIKSLIDDSMKLINLEVSSIIDEQITTSKSSASESTDILSS